MRTYCSSLPIRYAQSNFTDFIIFIISYSCRWRYCTGILHYQRNKGNFQALATLLSLSLSLSHFINRHRHHFCPWLWWCRPICRIAPSPYYHHLNVSTSHPVIVSASCHWRYRDFILFTSLSYLFAALFTHVIGHQVIQFPIIHELRCQCWRLIDISRGQRVY